MKLKELFEAPLPEDWDEAVFDEAVPFLQRVQYAKQMATEIGKGSGRIAFVIPYKGRETVLKIAKNYFGAEQNKEESQILLSGIARRSGIVIPMIDYDTSNSYPTWIHTEKATRMDVGAHNRMFNGEPLESMMYIAHMIQSQGEGIHPSPETLEMPVFKKIYDLVSELPWIDPTDFASHRNWGIYKGRPVIIDLGISLFYGENNGFHY